MLENNGFFRKTMGFFKAMFFDTTFWRMIYFDYKACVFYQNKNVLHKISLHNTIIFSQKNVREKRKTQTKNYHCPGIKLYV